MNNHNDHENIITEVKKDMHDIKKYNFRTMQVDEDKKHIKEQEPKNTTSTPEISQPQITPEIETPLETPKEPVVDAPALKLFETEVVDKILQKSDDLAQSLQKMQEQLNKQEQEFSEKINIVEAKAKEMGYNEGYQKAKEELQIQIDKEKELYALSVQRMDENLTKSKEYIANLEKELSAIAIDIAKEVIITDVSTNSAKIASSLARSLLQNIAQSVPVTLKVFPGDLDYLKESLVDLQNVTLESDKAITKGGVVIMSNDGNIDGDLQVRFEAIKKSILGNKLS